MTVHASPPGSWRNSARHSSKRPVWALAAAIALSLLSLLTVYWGSQQAASCQSAVSSAAVVEARRCAVLSFDGCNADIWAGVAYAWQSAGCRVDIYSPSTAGAGICQEYKGLFQVLMESWFEGSWLHVEAIFKRAHEYSILGVVPFPVAQVEKSANPALMFEVYLTQQLNDTRFAGQKIYAEINNPRWLRRPNRLALLKGLRERLFIDTLSPPFSTYTEQMLYEHGVSLLRPPGFFTPAMPLNERLNRKIEDYGSGALNASNLCIQGILDPLRRDYGEVFRVVEAVQGLMIATNQKLYLVGSNVSMFAASVRVPHGLQPLVKKFSNLGTENFYEVLLGCRALFTAFSREDYFISKSSSTISTALNLGIPLITDTRTMGVYPFLNLKSVFLFEPPMSKMYWETYTQAVTAALTAGPVQRRAMLKTKAQMAEHNKEAAERLFWA